MSWSCADVRRQRDRALIQLVEAEARLRELREQRDALRGELTTVHRALERVVDNALFAAGAAPAFHPEDARFQPKSMERQLAEADAARTKPVGMNPAEWRRKVEALESERAARDSKTAMVEELRTIAAERKGQA